MSAAYLSQRTNAHQDYHQVFFHLSPKDMLTLCRAHSSIRKELFRDFWVPSWTDARANICDAPPPPPGMSEVNYASFIAEKQCMVRSLARLVS